MRHGSLVAKLYNRGTSLDLFHIAMAYKVCFATSLICSFVLNIYICYMCAALSPLKINKILKNANLNKDLKEIVN